MPKLIKYCKCCGKQFETVNPQKLFCDGVHYLPCPVCGKPVLKKGRDFTQAPTCCSPECTKIKHDMNLHEKTCVICGDKFKPKSGVATICEKEHHGNCVICGKDIIITKKMWHDGIDTCSRKCAKEKLRRFYQVKYGVDHPMQNSKVQEHHRQAMLEKYGAEHALQVPDILESAYQTNLRKFGTKYACVREECRQYVPIPNSNKRYGKLLENLNFEVEYEVRIDSRIFDLYLPECKTFIEIDPTYTHNSWGNHWDEPLDPDYHRNKSNLAIDKGYRCVHVFDWDATEKIIDLFRTDNRIGARKCELKEVPLTECNKFLNEYHLQGRVYKQVYRLGLYYNNELIQVMTFGTPRYDKKHDIELLRLCSKRGYVVIGGAEKLFKHALDDNPSWKSIISYCDLAKFSGEVYSRLNMKRVRTTPPQIVWSKGADKVTSTLLRQRGYDQLFNANYGKGTSNEELMLEHGWLPVYDCGQAVYVYERS